MHKLIAITLVAIFAFPAMTLAFDIQSEVVNTSATSDRTAMDITLSDENKSLNVVAFSSTITAKKANFANWLRQFTGAAIGNPVAANSRYAYLYDVNVLSKLDHGKIIFSSDGTEVVYVLSPRKDAADQFIGFPLVVRGGLLGKGQSLGISEEEADRILGKTVNWALSEGLKSNLDPTGKTLIGFSTKLGNIEPEKKVIITGATDWNVYTDAAAFNSMVQAKN